MCQRRTLQPAQLDHQGKPIKSPGRYPAPTHASAATTAARLADTSRTGIRTDEEAWAPRTSKRRPPSRQGKERRTRAIRGGREAAPVRRLLPPPPGTSG